MSKEAEEKAQRLIRQIGNMSDFITDSSVPIEAREKVAFELQKLFNNKILGSVSAEKNRLALNRVYQ